MFYINFKIKFNIFNVPENFIHLLYIDNLVVLLSGKEFKVIKMDLGLVHRFLRGDI